MPSATNARRTSHEKADVDIDAAFRKYDRNKSNFIEIQELQDAMADLGLITSSQRSSLSSSQLVISTMKTADKDGDDRLNRAEFAKFYLQATAPSLSNVMRSEHPVKANALRKRYEHFANFGKGNRGNIGSTSTHPPQEDPMLGTAHWMKLCRDTGLVSRAALSSADADLVFARVKSRGRVKISFEEFVDALNIISKNLEVELMEVVDLVIADGKEPTFNTRLAPDRLGSEVRDALDGKEETTSSEGHGTGPCEDGTGERNVKKTMASEALMIRSATSLGSSNGVGGLVVRPSITESFRSVSPIVIEQVGIKFGEFAEFGNPSANALSPLQREMDSKQFAKLCKESGVSKRNSDTVAVDLAFAKARSGKSRRLSFADFLVAVALLAQDLKIAEADILDAIASCPGPRRNSNATFEYVRLYDDVSTYTGVCKRDTDRLSDPAPSLINKHLF